MVDQINDRTYDVYMNNEEEEEEEEAPLALIVEDDKINQNFLKENLINMGLECVMAETASEAEKTYMSLKAQNRSIDVVFLDIYLKDGSLGTQFLRKVREKEWLDRAMIIVMSGAEDEEVMKECYQLKCTNFIPKPIKKNHFINESIKIAKYMESLRCPLVKYKIEKTLGSGASGVVELIRHKKTKELYALKTIKLETNNRNSSELEYNKLLRCPLILQLIEYRVSEENMYLVLEYAEFGTLSHAINQKVSQKQKFDVDTILNWMAMLLLGLFEIHEKNLMHRDIKSDNLFICKKNVLKIGDLGIARATEKNIAITVCGTFNYRAPEVFHWKEYTNKVDIWSAGVVLYELIMQKVPFEGDSTEIIKCKLDNMTYEPLPDDTDKRLIELLNCTLVYNVVERKSALDILKKDFMRERVDMLFKNNVIDDVEWCKMITERIALSFKIPVKISEPVKGPVSVTDDKMKNYYNTFKTAMKIDALSVKTSYKSGLLSTAIDNVVSGADIRMLAEDNGIDITDIEEAIEKKFLLNIVKPNSLVLEDKSYYQIKINEKSNIDNSIIFSIDSDVIDIIAKDPVSLSVECLNQIISLKKKFDNGINDDEVDIEKLKTDIFSSEEFLEFAYSIRKLKYLKMEKYTKEQKLATILNIYQTMYYHLTLKNAFTGPTSSSATGVMDLFKQVFKKDSSQCNIIYEIAGQTLSLYEMKHIVIRRNRKPLDQYFRLVYDSDARVRFIEDDNNLLKFHMICLDPPTSEDNIILNTIVFSDKTVYEQIDDFAKTFVNEAIKKEDSILHIPMLFKNYMTDFCDNEQDLIKHLLKLHTDPALKPMAVIRSLSTKDLTINYY
jgi:serine/threonine protein kinase